MIYDELSQIKFNGVDDAEDSPVAAAMAALFTGQEPRVFNYFKDTAMLDKYQRCYNSKYTFSRDQFVCLAVVLKLNRFYTLVSLDKVDGKDFMSPAIRGHERICKGLEPYWYQTLWFKMDLIFSAKVKPLEELNQLFCMLLVHPDQSLIKWYCGMNTQWRDAINLYFRDSFRKEPELAKLMIEKIEERIK